MESKRLIWLGMIAGSFIGGLVPSLWDAGMFSFSGIIFSAAGAIAGIYIAFKITRY